MNRSAHKTEGVNRTKAVWSYPFVSTGNDPRKGWRIPLNEIKYNEQHEEETSFGYCDDYQPHAAVDEKYFSYYVYDHSGGSCASREQSQACLSYAEMEQRRRSQRRLKLVGDNSSMDVCQRLRTPQNKLNEVSNADLMATYTVLNNPTLYPSAYMVLTNKGYTNVTEVESRASSLALPRCSNVTERKHYYAGTDLCASREQSQACLSYAETKQSVRSNRVAARLGGGGLDAQQHVIAIDDELQSRADKLFKQSLDHVNHRVLGENDLNCIMRNKFSPEVLGEWIDGIPYHVRADVETEYWQFKEMVYSMLEDPNNGHEKEVFFYHSDHLGSASWITDYRGMAVQHIQYLPYGEPYINQRPFGYSERFTFTGKERDEETGYGYFGARYMDHELMTMWLSVDPMADKYPSISPYAYCAWNPVKLVDPDGREIYMLFYTTGNEDGDDMFKAAALTRKRDIENSSSFNKDNDIVVLCEVSDLSSIQGSVDRIQKKYEKYGKTKEFDIWSHAGLDGPTGSTMTSTNRLDDGSGRNQMSLEGWGSINFDWSDNASASFYGCRTGVEDNGSSFAQRVSTCKNFSGVLVSGMSDYSFPSYSSSSYQMHSDIYIISEKNSNIVYKPTYMVSTNGIKRRHSNDCNPPNRYKNGKKIE